MASPANEDLESLLQGFKDQYQEAQQQKTQPQATSSTNNQNSDKTDEIQDLLSQAKSKFQNQASQKKKTSPASEKIDQNVKDLRVNAQKKSEVNHLESWKSNFQSKQTQNQSQQDFIYQRNKQDIISQEQQKQLNYKRKKQQAQKWLANLEPHSDEGMWFNQLADSYESRLEAAITYLDTLEQ